MSILKASILFSRAGTVYNQVRIVSMSTESKKYQFRFDKLLKEMEAIYGSDNTRANRLRLHDFIKDNALEIAKAYSELFEHRSDAEGEEYYSLKEE